MREGSLEAPTRHPLAWHSDSFWDRQDLERELERVYDICHGCRRCVSLCESFPTLFDLVDESETLEVDGFDKGDYHKVVEQCYLCDLCYMTKCPYVPPHEWNVDFPHQMLRAKAVAFRVDGAKRRDRQGIRPTLGQSAGQTPGEFLCRRRVRLGPRIKSLSPRGMGSGTTTGNLASPLCYRVRHQKRGFLRPTQIQLGATNFLGSQG